jgi:hypothetical protein
MQAMLIAFLAGADRAGATASLARNRPISICYRGHQYLRLKF